MSGLVQIFIEIALLSWITQQLDQESSGLSTFDRGVAAGIGRQDVGQEDMGEIEAARFVGRRSPCIAS